MGISMGAIGGAIISFIIAMICISAYFVDMGSFGEFMLNYSYYFHILTVIFMIGLFLLLISKTISPEQMII